MVRRAKPTAMPQAMIRSAFLLALASMLWAASAHAQASDADLVTRVDHLEAEIRDLTGTIEQLKYRNQQLEQQVQQFQAGGPAAAPQRPAGTSPPPSSQYTVIPQYTPPPPAPYSPPPGPVIATAPAAAPPPDSDASPRGHGDAFNPALNPNAPGVPRPLGASTTATEPPPVSDAPIASSAPRQPGAPLDLSSVSAPPDAAPPAIGPPAAARPGELPPPPLANPSGTGAEQAALPPSNTPRDDYDLAYGYVLQKQYGPAANAFRDFLQKYPSDRLAAEAEYWLGESLYQNQQYHDAAEAFLAVSTKYETAARAPDALLGLGQSLAALGEKEAACASLGEVLRKYPKASPSVKQTVDREQKRVHC
jgi:tol-pal system protein YbgF